MRPSFPLFMAFLATLHAGCLAPAWQDVTEHFTATATDASTGGSTTAPATTDSPTTASADPVATVTGPPAETTGTTAAMSTSDATDPEEIQPPVIDHVGVTPGLMKSAGIVTVEVSIEGEGADALTITVDGGESAPLSPVGDSATLFTGEIVVSGESWNGDHEVVALAVRGEKSSEPWATSFEVQAPAAGSEAWLKKSPLVPSYGNAVDVDDEGDVLELFTSPTPNGQECYLRRRDETGEPVWIGDARWIAPFEDCAGEDVKFAPDGTIWVLVNVYKDGFGRWQLWHLDADGMPLGQTPEVGSLTHLGRGLDVNAEGAVLLCGVRPATKNDDDAWVRLQPVGDGAWTVPWDYRAPFEPDKTHQFTEKTQGCAFIEDRIVVVGEAWGMHQQGDQQLQNRGFAVEFNLAAVKLAEIVNPAALAWHSGHHAVAPDGEGGYVTVGYNCAAMVTPCNSTVGSLRWFSLDAKELKMQPVMKAKRIYDVARSPAGYVVVAAQAVEGEQGFLVQGWVDDSSTPVLEYQSAKTKLQVATGVAADRIGFILAGGYFQEADDVLAAGVARVNPY